MLNAHHAVLDDQGIPAYLEAWDLRTRQLCLDHGYAGYCPPIELLPDGPVLYPMFRQPATGAVLPAAPVAAVPAVTRPALAGRPVGRPGSVHGCVVDGVAELTAEDGSLCLPGFSRRS